MIVDLLPEPWPEDLGELVMRRTLDPGEAAESLQQLLAARRADPRQRVKTAAQGSGASPSTMPGNREAMRLVADLLEQL